MSSSFNRNHYNEIGTILFEAKPSNGDSQERWEQWENTVTIFANRFEEMSPRINGKPTFNRDKFYGACAYNSPQESANVTT